MLQSVHRRYNPLRDSWVLCSPHRTSRPWQGAQETVGSDDKPEYDSKCYLCPKNQRANGESNPAYESTFVFDNDFAAVTPKTENTPAAISGDLFRAEPVNGNCKVICFSPKHNVTLAHMAPEEIVTVIDAWKAVYNSAKADKDVNYCQIFENKGAAMGCSNPHPHGQAWMTSVVPDEPRIEHECLLNYYKKHNTHMLEDYVAKEEAVTDEQQNRIIDANDTFVLLVPFWATWPFETMIVSRKRIGSIADLTPSQQKDFADIISRVTIRYDNLFKCSFPYSMGIHQSFVGGDEEDVEHLLLHFYPPLLRSATVRKFLVGFELLGMPQRDITPETAAQSLRQCSLTHYSKQ